MTSPSILLIGASGYLGPYLSAEFLRRKDKFSRLAILTEESKKEKFVEVEKAGFELVFGSFLKPKSFEGFDTVLSLLGNHAMKYQPAIIDAAFTGGVTDFYPSEFGSDIEYGETIHNRRRSKPHFTVYGGGDNGQVFTSVADVARYTVASTLLPKSPNRIREFRTCGGEYTWKEIIATISRAGGVDYKPIFLPNEEAKRLAIEAKEKGDVDKELAFSLKELMGSDDFRSVPKPWDNERFDIVPETLEDALKRYFQAKQ